MKSPVVVAVNINGTRFSPYARLMLLVVLLISGAAGAAELPAASAAPTTQAANTPAPAPYGIVPPVPNAGHVDPGRALNKEDNPFYPSRTSTEGMHLTTDMFDPPEVCGGCHINIYQQGCAVRFLP